jgi:hypothetical protein
MWSLKAAAVAGVLLALSATAGAAPVTFNLNMSGANEPNNAGDPDATGTALLTLDPDQDMVTWTVNFQNVTGDNISGFHIHGPGATPTSNVGVYINMTPLPPPPAGNGTISGMIMELDTPGLGAKIDRVLQNPSEFYINLHSNGTGGFPGGAIRAMLPEPGCLSFLALAGFGLLRRRGRVAA